MAIEKQHTLNRLTFPASYWIIAEIHISPVGQTVWIDLWGFQDSEAREGHRAGDGTQPIEKRRVEVEWHRYLEYFNVDRLSESGNNPVKAAYEFLSSVYKVGDNLFFEDGESV